MVVSLWNLTGTSAAVLPRYLPNFRAIGKVETRISRLRDFTRSCCKTSYRLVNRGPDVVPVLSARSWWRAVSQIWEYTPKGFISKMRVFLQTLACANKTGSVGDNSKCAKYINFGWYCCFEYLQCNSLSDHLQAANRDSAVKELMDNTRGPSH